MTEEFIARRRQHEEDYFRQKDLELIEKMREQARAEQELRDLGRQVGVTDPELARELASLGFTVETIKLLIFLPVLETAWAEGGVTAAERTMVIDLARARGIEAGSAADLQLTEWLDRRPGDVIFQSARRLIGALFASGGRFEITPDDLIKYCESIAEASGGLFGLRRVSSDERATLERIAGEIRNRPT